MGKKCCCGCDCDVTAFEIDRASLLKGLDDSLKAYEVAACVKDGDKYLYDYIKSAKEIILDNKAKFTVLPPKKFLFPQEEQLLQYSGDKIAAKTSSSPQILFGIRPCDLNGIKILDEAFAEGNGDPNYLAKRELTTVIGMECVMPCHEYCYCYKVGSHNAVEGSADLMLYNLCKCENCEICGSDSVQKSDGKKAEKDCGCNGCNRFLMRVITKKGAEFAKEYFSFDTKTKDHCIEAKKSMDVFLSEKSKAFDGRTFDKLCEFPEMFERNKHHKVWEEEGNKCLSCGSCIMVCPTCYCFDVIDDSGLDDFKKGTRCRTWDACMLNCFAAVTGDENFRKDVKERLKHRINRKFNYLMKKHGQSVCVGCGRCVKACLAKISPEKIAQMLIDSEKKGIKHDDNSCSGHSYSCQCGCEDHMHHKDDVCNLHAVDMQLHVKDERLYLPRRAKIIVAEDFTEKDKFFRLQFEDGKPLGNDPGQFVMVSMLGIGEAPISITSPPSSDACFELCFKSVGDVTRKMHELKVDDTLLVRGPFGHGYNKKTIESMYGKQLVFIAGGIGYAPVRSLINKVLGESNKYDKIYILYGHRDTQDRLYSKEIDGIIEMIKKDKHNVKFLETIDKGDPSWSGNVGVITTLIPKIDVDVEKAVAAICGPPIMYKFVLKSLLTANFKKENIYMSLERRMKCGVGKCGHCKLEGMYACQEGPVFRYKDIENNEEAI